MVRGSTRAAPNAALPVADRVTVRCIGCSSRPSTVSTRRPANSADSGTFGSYQGAPSPSGLVYGASPTRSAVNVSQAQAPTESSGLPTDSRYAANRALLAISVPPRVR